MFGFSRDRTIKDTVKDFPDQLRFVKVFLYKKLCNEYGVASTNAHITEHKVLAAQITNFLTGDIVAEKSPNALPEAHKIAERLKNTIPKKSQEFMQNTLKEVRELVVCTLRIKLIINLYLKGDTYWKTDDYKRITNVLNIYGSEFPEEANARKYKKLVYSFLAK